MAVFVKLSLVTCIIVIIGKTNGANILGLMGIPSPSHHIWNSALMHELGARGHNVTILSVDLPKKGETVPKNVHYIYLDEVYETMYNSSSSKNISDYSTPSILTGIYGYYYFCYMSTKSVWKSKGNEILFNYPNNFKFDLVIYDYTCGGILLPYLHKFNYPPLIGISPYLNPPITLDIVGGHIYSAYIPFISTQYDKDMNFLERLSNTVIYYFDVLIRRYIYIPLVDGLIRSYWQKDIPYLSDLEQRTTLALVNTHPAVNHPEPIPSNIIEVGGLHLVDAKPLQNDIENFINGSIKGAIFVSLGTNMRCKYLGFARAKIFLDAMTQLPEYNFLWKCDTDPGFKMPKNVLLRPFFPQRNLLGHPNLKAFVTHGGGLSTQEAIWNGVPLIGIPLFLDQHGNIQRSISLGVAEKVEYTNLSVDILKDMILKVTENPKYTENAKILSQRYRDQQIKPLDNAVWWTEYILRNPQPSHLHSPTIKLGFIRSNSLDVICFLLLFILSGLWLIYLGFKNCFCNRAKNITKHEANTLKKKI